MRLWERQAKSTATMHTCCQPSWLSDQWMARCEASLRIRIRCLYRTFHTPGTHAEVIKYFDTVVVCVYHHGTDHES
jgi:hypothetical protein